MLASPIFFVLPIFPFTPFAAKSCHFFCPASSTFFCSSFRPFFAGFCVASNAPPFSPRRASASSAFIAAGWEMMAPFAVGVAGEDDADDDSSFRFLLAEGLRSLG